jgi:hypothetical protein
VNLDAAVGKRQRHSPRCDAELEDWPGPALAASSARRSTPGRGPEVAPEPGVVDLRGLVGVRRDVLALKGRRGYASYPKANTG